MESPLLPRLGLVNSAKISSELLTSLFKTHCSLASASWHVCIWCKLKQAETRVKFWLVVGLENTPEQYWQGSQTWMKHSEVSAVQVNALEVVLCKHSAFALVQLRQDWAVQPTLGTLGILGGISSPNVQLLFLSDDSWLKTLCRRSDRKRRRIVETVSCGWG